MIAGSFHTLINPSTYQPLQKYELSAHQRVIVVRKRAYHAEQVALRLRVGRVGYSQWLNELYVYLLPNFRHKNILPLLGYDKRLLDKDNAGIFNSKILDSKEDESDRMKYDYEDDDDDDDDDNADEQDKQPQVSSSVGSSPRTPRTSRASSTRRSTIEYWLVNAYSSCITLRHFLMMHTISWNQLIGIAHGIMCGVHYLHDNADYTCATPIEITRSVDGYIRATKGALKKTSFRDSSGILHLKPHLAITIIHRNLSSLNIVLGPNLEARIWNFGFAYVYHPFQPLNFDHYVDAPIKEVHMSSPYSPPEVLSEHTYFTHQALKSHDVYSCGMLLYELLSRCVLPKIVGAPLSDNLERADPLPYAEPFAREFNFPGRGSTREMLQVAVCRHRTRPGLRRCWLLGKKSNRFVQLIRELWDQDFEARIHCCTAIDRLERTSMRLEDKPNKYPVVVDRVFNYESMWPPEEECHQAPRGALSKTDNLIFESLDDLKILAYQKKLAEPASSSSSSSSSSTTTTNTTSSSRDQSSYEQPNLTPTNLSGESQDETPSTLATPLKTKYSPQPSDMPMTSRISPIKVPVKRAPAAQSPDTESQPTTSRQ